ncbi:MAG TPA: hypothetical protein VFI44_10365, partial [Ornithinibacter sp.]|nr:hypothetical protein [Ornithinibacter sp.]
FRAATRAGLVGGAALLAAALTVTSASAASAELSYSCDYGVGDTEGTGAATAGFDSSIGEGLVVEVGDEVSIDPFGGEITLPDGFTEALRDAGVDAVDGARAADTGEARGLLLTFLDESEEEYVVELSFGTTPVPAEGPLVLEVAGEGGSVFASVVGTNTLVANDFGLEVGTGVEGPDAGMYCALTDEGDVSIDSFEATAAATPTTTTTSATPVRPVVVQTDFAGDDRSTALPLLAAGAVAAGTVALLVGRGARRDTLRRH